MLTQRKALVLVTFVLLGCALLQSRWTKYLTKPTSNIVLFVQTPARWVASQLKTDPEVEVLTDVSEIELRELLASAQAQNEALWEENARLKQQIDSFNAIIEARPMESIRMVDAAVSRFNNSEINPMMTLLRGSLHGIKQGDPVAFKSNLIGFTTDEIGPVNATVELITRPSFSIGVNIKPPLRKDQKLGEGWPFKTRVISDGKGAFYCDLDEAVTAKLRPGDEVRVADSILDSANGLLLGVIKEIRKDVGERPLLEDRVVIVPLAPIGPQRTVTVLTEDND